MAVESTSGSSGRRGVETSMRSARQQCGFDWSTDRMSQRPGGDVVLRNADGEHALVLDQENYYVRGVRAFQAAIAGDGGPTATGEDGLISLAVKAD